MTKAIFFDFDGTLANTLPLYIKAYDRALKRYGFNFSNREIVTTCFSKTEKVICEKLNIPDRAEEFTSLYFSGIEDYFNEAKLFENVLEVLDLAQKKQVKLAIISFAYRWYVDRMLSQLDLNKYFKLVVGFEDVTQPKPGPEAVLIACEKLKIETQNSVVIGDSRSDMLMGKSAGSQTILFHPQDYGLFYNLETLKKSHPDHIAQNFKEIKQILF